MQTIGGVLGGASLGVVRHAEVRNAGAEVGDDGGVVVDGGEGGVVLPRRLQRLPDRIGLGL